MIICMWVNSLIFITIPLQNPKIFWKQWNFDWLYLIWLPIQVSCANCACVCVCVCLYLILCYVYNKTRTLIYQEVCTSLKAPHHPALHSFRWTYLLFNLLPPSCGIVTVRAESWHAGEMGRCSEVTLCQKFTGKLTYLEDGNGLKRGCLTLRSWRKERWGI